jgi:hypothetical protein
MNMHGFLVASGIRSSPSRKDYRFKPLSRDEADANDDESGSMLEGEEDDHPYLKKVSKETNRFIDKPETSTNFREVEMRDLKGLVTEEESV